MNHRLIGVALVASVVIAAPVVIAGCSDPASSGATGDTGGGSNLGVEGASCLRSADCESPLQCIHNVCVSVGDAGPDATDADGETADTFHAPDTFPTDTAGNDATADTHLPVPDVPEEADLSGWDTFADTAPDTAEDAHTDADLFAGCEALGISEHWSGPFEGLIEFHVSDNPLTPSDGELPVTGTLSYDITCVGTKLVVNGTMDGTATIEGQAGEFPFTLKIQGFYSPTARKMTASLVDGQVVIYGLVIVYFVGDFEGDLGQDGNFVGTWTGHSTGTNQQFITGTAAGDGTWSASPL